MVTAMEKKSRESYLSQREVTDKEVRERLVIRGAASLSNAELLSVILQQGPLTSHSIKPAMRVLEEVDGELSSLSKMELSKLRQLGSMGIKRAALVATAIEFGRRVVKEESRAITTISSNSDVIELFRPLIGELEYEEFWVLYLSSANTVLDKVRVSKGGVSGTVVDKRIVVKRGLELLASSLILVHNHPSGIATPSEEDRRLTSEIEKGAKLFEIAVLDHLVITSGESFSFRQAGLIVD